MTEVNVFAWNTLNLFYFNAVMDLKGNPEQRKLCHNACLNKSNEGGVCIFDA